MVILKAFSLQPAVLPFHVHCVGVFFFMKIPIKSRKVAYHPIYWDLAKKVIHRKTFSAVTDVLIVYDIPSEKPCTIILCNIQYS